MVELLTGRITTRWVGFGIAVVLAIAGCGGDDDAQPAEAAQAGGITVNNAWVRPVAGEAASTAFYMTISNDGSEPDQLVGARSTSCGAIEIHMTTIQDDVTQMSPVAGGLPITPGATIELGPGALHIMCIDVIGPLTTGATAEITLEFSAAGEIAVDAEIRQDG